MASRPFPTLLVLSWLGLACADRTLAGPDAQEAFSRATGAFGAVPHDLTVFVDGHRLAAGARLGDLDPSRVARIEVVKAGAQAARGAIHIYTIDYQSPDSAGTR